MNFVADQFKDFQRTFERALNGGKIRPDDDFLSTPQAYGTYKNPKVSYEEYFSNLMSNFENIFLNRRRTLSAESYFQEFMAYIQQNIRLGIEVRILVFFILVLLSTYQVKILAMMS